MTARADQARRISDIIAGLDDSGVRTIMDGAKPVGIGLGGETKTACIGATTIVVKQLPLTTIEETDPTATARGHLV